MMMDYQTALFCLGFVVISAAILLFISVVVTKEKSYEEAIAEQRQQTGILLGMQSKTKVKDKKQKKAGKKVKEKLQSIINDAETTEESETSEPVPVESNESTSSSANHPSKHHVEFKEPQILDEQVKEVVKRRKKDKVRPILLNRDMSEEKIVQVDEVPSANHFEQLHPKDEFELLHSHLQKEEVTKQEVEKEKPKTKQSTDNESKSSKKAAKHQANEIIAQNVVEKEEVAVEQPLILPQTNGVVSGANVGKEKKKKKAEQNAMQQLAGDKQGVTLQSLTTLVRKAELSRSEVQILIDMLLNKQHEAPAVIDEWSEGKADPLQKLKKQLAEKEKLLAEEQEALVGAQAKLKEVRAEQSAERAQLQQKARSLNEALNNKQLELHAVNNRIHGLNQKIQTLQTQLNEEMIKNRKLLEDNNTMQMHRQQFELHLTQADEAKESLAQLQGDFRSLTEQFEHQKSMIGHLQYELSQKDEVLKQLEEARMELEHHMNLQIRQDNDLKVEISQLKTACQQHLEEIRRLELNKSQSLSDMKAQQEEYENTISQLNQELQRVNDEKQEIELYRENEALEEEKAQIKIRNLQNELSSHIATVEKLQLELAEQKEKNNDLRKKNWKVMEALNAAENRNKTQTTVINREVEILDVKEQEHLSQKNMLQRLFPHIKGNDNLPHDQWILQIENSIKNYITKLEKPRTPEPVDNSEVIKLQMQIQKNKQSLDEYDSLLIELQSRTAQTEMQWRKEIERKNEEIAIKDRNIKDKENRIALMENEITILKEDVQQLRLQLSDLELKLQVEREANQRLTNDEAIKLRHDKGSQSDTTLQLERLQEEINRMSEQLLEEQRRNTELTTQINSLNNLSSKAINHNNTSNGPPVTVENNGNQQTV